MKHQNAKNVAQDVLAFLANHYLEPTPNNYRFGYLFVTKASKLIVDEVADSVVNHIRIREEDVENILLRYSHSAIVEGRVEIPEKVANVEVTSEDLKSEEPGYDSFVQTAHELIKQTQRATGEFHKDIAHDNEIIRSGVTGDKLTETLLHIVERSEKAERQLAEASNQIDRLQIDLSEAQNKAYADELTNLPNRRAARQLMEECERDGEHIVVTVIDIDNFKRVNDEFGHEVGDRVIKMIGNALKTELAPDMVARWGGEEFLVISKAADVRAVHERIDAARIKVRERRVKVRDTDKDLGMVTVSAGVEEVVGNIDSCIARADSFLYEAKKGGRDQVRSASLLKDAA